MVFLVFRIRVKPEGLNLLIQLTNDVVTLFKFVFNKLEFLRVRKCILRLNDIFQLLPQPYAFVHIELDLDLNFRLS